MQINTDLSSFLSVAGRREEAISLAMELLVAPACPHLTFGAQRGEGKVEVVLSAVSGPEEGHGGKGGAVRPGGPSFLPALSSRLRLQKNLNGSLPRSGGQLQHQTQAMERQPGLHWENKVILSYLVRPSLNTEIETKGGNQQSGQGRWLTG